jgi:poly(A) polymerase
MRTSLTDLGTKFPDILKRIGAVADRLEMNVFAVGGYVRDLLLNETGDPKDIDLAVVGDALALAHQLKQEFGARILVTYKRFATTMMEVSGYKLELVTARRETPPPSPRQPSGETACPESDLARRDFTINSMAVGLNKDTWGTLYDPFKGVEDLGNRIIRTPLNPQITFEDDPLRMLRAVRFAALLDFRIEQRTQAAIQRMARLLMSVAEERISDELLKMLGGSRPSRGLVLMDRLKILPYVLPELAEMKGVEQRDDFHHKDVFHHTLEVVDKTANVSDKLKLRLAALFHDVGKPSTKAFDDTVGWTFHRHDQVGAEMMEAIARRLRISKEVKSYIQKLIRLHLRPIFLASTEVTDSAIRRLIVQAGDELDDLFQLCRADVSSANINRVKEHLKNLERVRERVELVRKKDKLHRFQSPVSGDEIMQVCKIPPGPMVGKLKEQIEEAILDGKIPNDHRAALAYLHEIKDRQF